MISVQTAVNNDGEKCRKTARTGNPGGSGQAWGQAVDNYVEDRGAAVNKAL